MKGKRSTSKPKPAAKNELFNSLKSEKQEKMSVDDIIAMFQKLDVELSDPIGGYFFYLMKSINNSVVTQEQFSNLTTHLKVDNLADFKKKIPVLRKEFQSDEVFKNVYQHLFDLSKETAEIKVVPFEVAQQVWGLYLQGRYPLSDIFLKFVQDGADKKNVNRDTWNMIQQFLSVTKKDFSNYNEMEGWPVFIDSFVEFAKSK